MTTKHHEMKYTLPSPGIDVTAPLIYMWEIQDASDTVVGRYIGKANGGEKRPTQHYTRNVNKLLKGLPYKKGQNYRRVHYSLADAVITGHRISLSYLCNVPEGQNIFEVETRYIHQYGCYASDGVGLNGPWTGKPRTLPTVLDQVTPLEAEVQPLGSDLEDFVECVQVNFPGLYVDSLTRGYSVWWGPGRKLRLVRAFQSSPGCKVEIKLAQTSLKLDKVVAFRWDGSDEQIVQTIENEMKLLAQSEAQSG